ncbi:MAG TPA: glycosyltransferase family 4 protein [Methanomassiliicoccales archaeon]|nr:glycosyltransferase family 4 protein [Methanomassiliicoccales archaeon]
MRIVEVNAFHYPFIGGIENRLHHICRRLGKEHEVFVLTSRLPGTAEREEMDNYTVIRLPSRYLKIYNPPYVRISKVREALDELRPDVVDLHYRWSGSLIKGVLGYEGPKIYTCHNTLGEGVGLTHYASELNDRLFLRHLPEFDRVVCVSDYMKRDVAARGFSEDRLLTIYNGVDIPDRTGQDGDYILSLGRLVRLKGLDYLIKAMQHTNCHLRVCGEGPERKNLERLSQHLGLTDRIDFMGWISEEEKKRMLCECRMFVIPSVHEAYGMVAAEAMSYGKPVIASNTGGLPEVVGDAGILVPPQDEMALAEAINALGQDEGRRAQLGNAAKERMKAFSWDEMAKRTLETYQEVVRKGQ